MERRTFNRYTDAALRSEGNLLGHMNRADAKDTPSTTPTPQHEALVAVEAIVSKRPFRRVCTPTRNDDPFRQDKLTPGRRLGQTRRSGHKGHVEP